MTAENSNAAGGSGVLPVDAHVHLHRLEDVPRTFDSAIVNFRRNGPGTGGLTGVLLLTQMSRERVFEALRATSSVGDWRIDTVPGEPESLIASRNEARLALVCGRQVRSDNGLEVAAYGTMNAFPDGRSFDDCLRSVVASGALAAVPWGFGKWIGRRGEIIRAAFELAREAGVFLGDSGSRNALLPEPALLREGRHAGLRVLPGTDPFPFGGDFRRVGSFGFLALVGPDCLTAPWRTLRGWLERQTSSPQAYGRPSGPLRFAVNQFGMQLYNRFPARAGAV